MYLNNLTHSIAHESLDNWRLINYTMYMFSMLIGKFTMQLKKRVHYVYSIASSSNLAIGSVVFSPQKAAPIEGDIICI